MKSEAEPLSIPEDVGAGGVIAAAIITSLVGAATAATTTLAGILASVKVGGGAVISNGSAVALELWEQGDPLAGVWKEQPKPAIAKMPSAQSLFDAWKESGEAPEAAMQIASVEDLTDSLIVLWEGWLTGIFQRDNLVSIFGLLGGLMGGVDGVVAYHNPAKSIGVAFYVFNPFIGKPQAGCSIADYSTMESWIKKDRKQLSNLIHHIRTTKSAYTQLSTGELQTVAMYDLKIKFAAGDIVDFNLSPN